MKDGLGTRWVKLVHRVPGLMLALVMAILASLALPTLNLQLALPNDKTANVDSTQRQAAEMLEQGFGPGRNTPFLVVVNGDSVNPDAKALQTLVNAQQANADAAGGQGADQQAAKPSKHDMARQAAFLYTVQEMSHNADVAHAQIVGVSDDKSTAKILVTPTRGPTDELTAGLIQQLRSQQNDIEEATGVDMGITGFTPIQVDVTERLSHAMPIYLALVVGLALVLLLMVFRSIAVTLSLIHI